MLRLVGARDGYIAQAFVRRFTLRALAGAAVGTVLGCIAVAAAAARRGGGGFLTGLGFQGWHWLLPLLDPAAGGGGGLLATRAAARRTLEGLCRDADAVQWIRSLLFIVQMYLAMAVIGLVLLSLGAGQPRGAQAACKAFCRMGALVCALDGGLRTEVRGTPPTAR